MGSERICGGEHGYPNLAVEKHQSFLSYKTKEHSA